MKTFTLISLSLVLAAFSVPALAHDSHEHDKQGAMAADCSKMKDMDMSKMDSNDPVMKAMQKKCKEQMNHEAMEHEHKHMESATTSAKTDASKKSTAAPDCSKMKSMDMSKMDMKDPAMKAMHDKCMQKMKHDDMKPMTHDSHSSSTTSGK